MVVICIFLDVSEKQMGDEIPPGKQHKMVSITKGDAGICLGISSAYVLPNLVHPFPS